MEASELEPARLEPIVVLALLFWLLGLRDATLSQELCKATALAGVEQDFCGEAWGSKGHVECPVSECLGHLKSHPFCGKEDWKTEFWLAEVGS